MICPLFSEPLYLLFVPGLDPLLYYTHIPAFFVSLLVGFVVLWNDRNSLLNRLLFGICVSFAVWTLCTLVAWTNIHSDIILFAWSLLGPAAAFISVLSVYFTYVYFQKKDVGVGVKVIFLTLLAPILILAPSTYTLSGFNLVNCDAFGFEGLTNTVYFPALGALAILWVFVLLVREYRHAGRGLRKQIVIMGTGLEFFLLSFFTTVFLGQYLATLGLLPDSQLETYGYFGMIVFAIYIGILIVRFKAFHVNLIAAQALVVLLLVLIGSQLTFVSSTTQRVLVGATLILTAIAGIVLIRSVNREIQQRERIERLAQDLTNANAQQVTLIHFITHQIKGFVTKSRNIFAMMKEGDFGVMPESAKPIIDQGFASDTKGLATIQEILNAANIKSGKVAFTMAPFDLKALIESIAIDLKPNAEAKGLALATELGTEPLTVTGDSAQLVNAYKNLIDNSIKYTPSGSVTLHLEKKAGKALFTVSDTGVGITAEDMAHLFTEGGHGKESTKINVDSTGFGLYIVKNIVEAHNGRVWAESEGTGKGSRFIVELPV